VRIVSRPPGAGWQQEPLPITCCGTVRRRARLEGGLFVPRGWRRRWCKARLRPGFTARTGASIRTRHRSGSRPRRHGGRTPAARQVVDAEHPNSGIFNDLSPIASLSVKSRLAPQGAERASMDPGTTLAASPWQSRELRAERREPDLFGSRLSTFSSRLSVTANSSGVRRAPHGGFLRAGKRDDGRRRFPTYFCSWYCQGRESSASTTWGWGHRATLLTGRIQWRPTSGEKVRLRPGNGLGFPLARRRRTMENRIIFMSCLFSPRGGFGP
jgi:hypothetical protein